MPRYRFFDCRLKAFPGVNRSSIEAFSSDMAAEIFCSMIHGDGYPIKDGEELAVEVTHDAHDYVGLFVVTAELEMSFSAEEKR